MRKRHYGHREFLKWLRSERKRFLNPPTITRSSYRRTDFLFEGVHTAIRGFYIQQRNSKCNSAITVLIKWENECVDFIFDLDLHEERTTNGYSCSLCLPEHQRIYPDRRALWIDHSFESFLE
jgi:hypothetical protein